MLIIGLIFVAVFVLGLAYFAKGFSGRSIKKPSSNCVRSEYEDSEF